MSSSRLGGFPTTYHHLLPRVPRPRGTRVLLIEGQLCIGLSALHRTILREVIKVAVGEGNLAKARIDSLTVEVLRALVVCNACAPCYLLLALLSPTCPARQGEVFASLFVKPPTTGAASAESYDLYS
jgi:hypothetical protein